MRMMWGFALECVIWSANLYGHLGGSVAFGGGCLGI